MTDLEKKLIDIANNEIGNIGQSTSTSLAVTDERYVCFSTYFDKEYSLLSRWKAWIRAYGFFLTYKKEEGQLTNANSKLTIYWRKFPKISFSGGKKILYARLLISNK